MTSSVRFDDSLPALVRTLRDAIGSEAVQAGVALRDGSGRLTFVVGRPEGGAGEREKLTKLLEEALGAYARPGRPILFSDDPGAAPTLSSPQRIPIQVEDFFCQLLDRRIVGSGWMDAPAAEAAGPPRVVFASVKGGVGRSTALAITAADLARRNRNVLVFDLDLEAPGIGDLMLSDNGAPEYGSIDFLVENGLGGVTEGDLKRFVASSRLTTTQGGRVDVVPALGARSMSAPENILPKISRAMIEDIGENGSISVSRQIADMVARITATSAYDLVLIDSRAGLAEVAASALLGLGATVLLFGTSQTQTVEGYRSLFSSLQLLAQRDLSLGRDAGWRATFKPVYAKASLDQTSGGRFQDDLYDLYSAHLYDEEETAADDEAFRFARDDSSAPHYPLVIPFTPSFVDFDPGRIEGQLAQPFYEQTFRPFLDGLDVAVQSRRNNEGQ